MTLQEIMAKVYRWNLEVDVQELLERSDDPPPKPNSK